MEMKETEDKPSCLLGWASGDYSSKNLKIIIILTFSFFLNMNIIIL